MRLSCLFILIAAISGLEPKVLQPELRFKSQSKQVGVAAQRTCVSSDSYYQAFVYPSSYNFLANGRIGWFTIQSATQIQILIENVLPLTTYTTGFSVYCASALNKGYYFYLNVPNFGSFYGIFGQNNKLINGHLTEYATNFRSHFDAVLQQPTADSWSCPLSVTNPSSSAWTPLQHTWTFLANGWAGVLNLTSPTSTYGAWDNQPIGFALNNIQLNGVEALQKVVCFERYGGTYFHFWRQGPNQIYTAIVSTFNPTQPSFHGAFVDTSGQSNSYAFDGERPLWLLYGNPVFPSVQVWNWQCAKWGVLLNENQGYISTVWGTNTMTLDSQTYPPPKFSLFVSATSPAFTIYYWYNHYGAQIRFTVPSFTNNGVTIPSRDFSAVVSDDGFHGQYYENGVAYAFDGVELNSC